MNKTYVVGVLNFFDNDLILEKISAHTWKEALCQHSEVKTALTSGLPDDMESAKNLAWDGDWTFDVIEV